MTTRTSSISIVATACDSAINRLTVQTHSWRNAIQRLYGHLRKHTLHLLQKRLSFTQGIHPYGLSSVIQSHNQQKDLFLAVVPLTETRDKGKLEDSRIRMNRTIWRIGLFLSRFYGCRSFRQIPVWLIFTVMKQLDHSFYAFILLTFIEKSNFLYLILVWRYELTRRLHHVILLYSSCWTLFTIQ